MKILFNCRIQNFFLQKPDTQTDSSGKPLNWKCTQHEKRRWTDSEQILEILVCTGLKKGDNLLNTIVTIAYGSPSML
jgi:phenylacetate-coenzyme A ligase PaaK-like adenylate-forming protein